MAGRSLVWPSASARTAPSCASSSRESITAGAELQAGFLLGGEAVLLPARVLACDGSDLLVAWSAQTLEEEARVVRVVFGRADAWVGWQPAGGHAVSRGAWRLLAALGMLVRRRAAACVLAGAILLAASLAHAQTVPGSSDLTVRPIPGVAEELPAPTPASPPQAIPAPAAPTRPAPAAPQPGTRTIVYTLRQLGAPGPLSLRGTTPALGVSFGIRADEVVTAATLSLAGAVSPGLMPELSNVTVTLNGEYLATIPADRRTPAFTADLPVTPALFRDENRLEFRLTGRSEKDCDDVLSGLLWATVADSSTLTLTLARLPPQRDLSRLPLPFLDSHERDTLTLPFVVPDAAPDDTLRAAGIAASWFGQLAGDRGATFPVLHGVPAKGDAVVVLGGTEGAAIPGLPAIDGPTLAVLPNPRDPQSSLLLVAGRTGAEAAAAAQALAMGIRALSGAVAPCRRPISPRGAPYDAPAWIPSDRPVRLGELVPPAGLQSSGYAGLSRVPFRTAPDFYTWRDRPFMLDLRWRAPPGPVVDLAASRLDVGLNGAYLDSLPLSTAEPPHPWLDRLLGPAARPASDARVALPLADLSGANDLQFYFDARPLRRDRCAAVPGDLRMAVDPDSTLDLSRGYHFAEMPNLGDFATSGFPFTRMADLSQTAIVLPDRPAPEEIGAFLDLMGRFGAMTGLPGVRVAVTRPDEVGGYGDRDLLVIGTMARLQAADPLLASSPLRLSGDRLQLTLGAAADRWHRLFGDGSRPDRAAAGAGASAALSAAIAPGISVMVGAESPLGDDRSVVAILAGGPAGLDEALRDLRDAAQARLIHGDLALLSGGTVTSYRVGPTYTVGSLPFWLWPSWYLRDQPLAAFGVLIGGCLVLGLALFWMMRRRVAGRLPPPRERRD